jgi:hypothetical protein
VSVSVDSWKASLFNITGNQLTPEPDVVFAFRVVAGAKNPMVLTDQGLWLIAEQVQQPVVRPLDNAILRHNENRHGFLDSLKIRFQLLNAAFGSFKLCERFL